jgi:bifunctional isochorismate lyase/aryl carrier protein
MRWQQGQEILCYNFFMKERYFSLDSLDGLAESWMNTYSRDSKSAAQPFVMGRAALLILDMQRYFLEEESHACVPAAVDLIPRINMLASCFRSAKRPVIASRHLNTDRNAGMMATWWADLLTADHPLSGIHPDLAVGSDEVLIKTQYDAFYRSDLDSCLKQNNVTQLVIGGVMTHLCCETTARAAFVSGYEVFFLVDGTASYNKEFHIATLQNLAHGVAVLTTTSQILEGQR